MGPRLEMRLLAPRPEERAWRAARGWGLGVQGPRALTRPGARVLGWVLLQVGGTAGKT